MNKTVNLEQPSSRRKAPIQSLSAVSLSYVALIRLSWLGLSPSPQRRTVFKTPPSPLTSSIPAVSSPQLEVDLEAAAPWGPSSAIGMQLSASHCSRLLQYTRYSAVHKRAEGAVLSQRADPPALVRPLPTLAARGTAGRSARGRPLAILDASRMHLGTGTALLPKRGRPHRRRSDPLAHARALDTTSYWLPVLHQDPGARGGVDTTTFPCRMGRSDGVFTSSRKSNANGSIRRIRKSRIFEAGARLHYIIFESTVEAHIWLIILVPSHHHCSIHASGKVRS